MASIPNSIGDENELGAILKVCDGYVKPQVIWHLPSNVDLDQSGVSEKLRVNS